MEMKEKDMLTEVKHHKTKLVERTERLLNLERENLGFKTMIQMYENTMERKKAKKLAYKEQHKEGNELMNEELIKHEERQNAVINANIMQGEDFRSIAFNNYEKIVEQQQYILCLSAEPLLLKERHLKLMTQLRREGERHSMEKEELRQEILRLYRVIDSKDEHIRLLDKRHEDSQYLITVIKQKLGADFDISHKLIQATAPMRETIVQTLYPQNHVSIQAHGFASVDVGGQTEKMINAGDSDGSDGADQLY